MRRYLGFAILVLIVAGGVTASAAESPGEGNTYTGCLSKGGALNKVAIGDEPARRCDSAQVQISWSEGVSPGELAALAQRVAELEAATQPLDLRVDCASGDSLSAALADSQDHPGPVDVTIDGVCEESAFVARDDVSFTGVDRSDGISVPASQSEAAVSLFDAHRISFSHMTISGGGSGLGANQSSFSAFDVTIRDSGSDGIIASRGSSGEFIGCTVTGHGRFGAETEAASTLSFVECDVTDNGDIGLVAFSGGTIFAGDSRVLDNSLGAVAQTGGTVGISSTLVQGNPDGGVNALSGRVDISGASRIVDNGQGVSVSAGSSAYIEGTDGPVVIEGNDSDGVSAIGGSDVLVSGVIVRDNGGNGISVGDLSTVSAPETAQVVDNGGWGISCDGPPGVAVLGGQGLFDPGALVLTGNANGDTNCG